MIVEGTQSGQIEQRDIQDAGLSLNFQMNNKNKYVPVQYLVCIYTKELFVLSKILLYPGILGFIWQPYMVAKNLPFLTCGMAKPPSIISTALGITVPEKQKQKQKTHSS